MKHVLRLHYELFEVIIGLLRSNEDLIVTMSRFTTRPSKSCLTPLILAGNGTSYTYLDPSLFSGLCLSATRQVMAGSGKSRLSGCKQRKKLPGGEKPTLSQIRTMNQMS